MGRYSLQRRNRTGTHDSRLVACLGLNPRWFL